jgi:lipoprotein-anchoring transpeptidase ErfK/SrfK
VGALAAAIVLGAGAYAFGAAGDRPPPRSQAANSSGAGGSPDGSASPGTAAPESTPSGVSAPSSAPASSAPARPPASGCKQGNRQREVETSLAAIGSYGEVTVDGVQSAADCVVIKKFQQRYGISPQDGVAGPVTADVSRRIAASMSAEEKAKCPGGPGLTACVSLTLQTVWVVRDGQVVFGPTVVRTGFRGYATPAGKYKINRRNMREWSIKYKVWLPYWQHFTSGMGFHETTNYIHNPGGGSHGCLNLLRPDAKEMWNLIAIGTTVHTFGRRPGT